MNNKFVNLIKYNLLIALTLMCVACLDSDDLDNILTPEPEVETLPIGEGLAIGATAPEFSLPNADSNTHSLSNYAGQKVVLVFFATEG